MTIIKEKNKVRLVKDGGYYFIQGYVGLPLFKQWKTISFGAYWPVKDGYSYFRDYVTAKELYYKCAVGEYSKGTLYWERGIL